MFDDNINIKIKIELSLFWIVKWIKFFLLYNNNILLLGFNILIFLNEISIVNFIMMVWKGFKMYIFIIMILCDVI